MPQGHLYAIARVFLFFLSVGLFGLSVGQSPSLSPLLSLSLSLSFPLPHALCAGRGEAHAEWASPEHGVGGGEFLSVLKEKFSRSSPLLQALGFRGKSPEFTHQYVFFAELSPS